MQRQGEALENISMRILVGPALNTRDQRLLNARFLGEVFLGKAETLPTTTNTLTKAHMAPHEYWIDFQDSTLNSCKNQLFYIFIVFFRTFEYYCFAWLITQAYSIQAPLSS